MIPQLHHWMIAGLTVLVALASPIVGEEHDDLAGKAASGKAKRQDAEALFVHRIQPLFKAKCLACHGEDTDDLRGEFNMSSRADLLKGGESGEPAIVVGKAQSSPLYEAIRWEGLEMPPKENDRLDDREIELVKIWIESGAPWPDAKRQQELLRTTKDRWASETGVRVSTSGGLSDEWTNRLYDPIHLWAYQPVSSELGAVDGNPIDVRIDARLRELQLPPATSASRRVLIRRATFDLLGLPPSPEEVEAFVNDTASDDVAFAKVVDRLLASPHYGEHWGRHWLDVARYADSSGYANDYERGNAWRYRDYVIRSFNDDKPYDEFVREQLAGDELEGTPEQLVAVGFLRMGPWELTGMEVPKIARQRFLDDVTDAVGQVFLGHMLQCARCHDHKFDPLPTQDYYAMQAIFATTQFADRAAPFLPSENVNGFDEKKYLQQRLTHYQKTLKTLSNKRTLDAGRKWLAEKQRDARPFEQAIETLKSAQKPATLDAVRNKMRAAGADPSLIPPRHAGFEPRDFGVERVCRKGVERMRWRMDRYEPIAFSVYAGHTPKLSRVNEPLRVPKDKRSGELESTAILVGGDPFAPQDPVSPSALSVVSFPGAPEIPDTISGRRLALAKWISSPNNPLTARVMANRIWQWHFGKPLAGNPNNFGTTGKKPTHPQLLDDLAARFIAEGWSVKSMHRIIMSSAAYRRSSQHPDPSLRALRDPNGEAYATFLPRRLSAEELRDAMLHVSGELREDVGGIPIRPEMNLEAALQPRQVMGTFAEAWQPSPKPSQRHRRSVYALRIRGQRDPFLEVFNSPASETSCEARETSTVTPQVFAMFNSEITFDRALAFAHRLSKEFKFNQDVPIRNVPNQKPLDRQQVLKRLFQIAHGRAPHPEELKAADRHWESMTQRHQELTFTAAKYPLEVMREAVEENTGERFTFVEPLEFFADFEPDLKPADASARLRGLAEVCLVLLNSNEFAYVY